LYWFSDMPPSGPSAQVPQVQPVAEGFFAGGLDGSKLPFLYRLIAKALRSPEGNFRNREAVRTWAGQVRAHLA
jgi:hypothetical protein